MSLAGALHLFDPSPSLFSLLFEEPELSFPFEIFGPSSSLFTTSLSPFNQAFHAIKDVTRLFETPLAAHYRRTGAGPGALEFGTDRFKGGDRKYTWKAEMKSSDESEADWKYQYTVEIKYEWTAEIKGRKEGSVARQKHDTCKVEKKEVPLEIKELGSPAVGKEKLKGNNSTRVLEIEESADHAAKLLRQAFGRRAGAVARLRGKRKELSPDEAAVVIERKFRAYLIRRSKALRSLREVAKAKAKLKEIRSLFNNYSYRQRISRDAEERERFSERIIALILTVDAIEGADLMVRAARRSMLDELEAMLDAVDPRPSGKLGFLKRRAV
ncbi:hypothetical protein COLO4_12507 [Corchorus olitorius]|uniref:BAG domain-containing protein n=1 Tax=Corchorus olitorius TaxID=93759 RepID=A0A1R3K0M2_9ROSI|nr:hypothetical protein COLO4_12507 [Corchorus olitorius]